MLCSIVPVWCVLSYSNSLSVVFSTLQDDERSTALSLIDPTYLVHLWGHIYAIPLSFEEICSNQNRVNGCTTYCIVSSFCIVRACLMLWRMFVAASMSLLHDFHNWPCVQDTGEPVRATSYWSPSSHSSSQREATCWACSGRSADHHQGSPLLIYLP